MSCRVPQQHGDGAVRHVTRPLQRAVQVSSEIQSIVIAAPKQPSGDVQKDTTGSWNPPNRALGPTSASSSLTRGKRCAHCRAEEAYISNQTRQRQTRARIQSPSPFLIRSALATLSTDKLCFALGNSPSANQSIPTRMAGVVGRSSSGHLVDEDEPSDPTHATSASAAAPASPASPALQVIILVRCHFQSLTCPRFSCPLAPPLTITLLESWDSTSAFLLSLLLAMPWKQQMRVKMAGTCLSGTSYKSILGLELR